MSKTCLFFNVFFLGPAPLLQMLFVCLGLWLGAAKRIKYLFITSYYYLLLLPLLLLSLLLLVVLLIFYALILD